MKVSELLPQIKILEKQLKARAIQFFDALGGFDGKSGIVSSIEYWPDQIRFIMNEGYPHFHETTTICIFAETLDLNDNDWTEFICKTYLETEEKEIIKNELNAEKLRQANAKKIEELRANLKK